MQVFDKYGVPTVLIYVSNVYLSCIYRICNVVDRGRVEGFRGRSQARYRLEVKGYRLEVMDICQTTGKSKTDGGTLRGMYAES